MVHSSGRRGGGGRRGRWCRQRWNRRRRKKSTSPPSSAPTISSRQSVCVAAAVDCGIILQHTFFPSVSLACCTKLVAEESLWLCISFPPPKTVSVAVVRNDRKIKGIDINK